MVRQKRGGSPRLITDLHADPPEEFVVDCEGCSVVPRQLAAHIHHSPQPDLHHRGSCWSEHSDGKTGRKVSKSNEKYRKVPKSTEKYAYEVPIIAARQDRGDAMDQRPKKARTKTLEREQQSSLKTPKYGGHPFLENMKTRRHRLSANP